MKYGEKERKKVVKELVESMKQLHFKFTDLMDECTSKQELTMGDIEHPLNEILEDLNMIHVLQSRLGIFAHNYYYFNLNLFT